MMKTIFHGSATGILALLITGESFNHPIKWFVCCLLILTVTFIGDPFKEGK